MVLYVVLGGHRELLACVHVEFLCKPWRGTRLRCQVRNHVLLQEQQYANRGYEPLLGICAVVVVKDNGIAYQYGSLPSLWRTVDVFLLDAPLVNSLPDAQCGEGVWCCTDGRIALIDQCMEMGWDGVMYALRAGKCRGRGC